MKQIYITPEGLEKAKKEHQEFIEEKRPEVIQKIESAKALGDLSENAEYHEAKEQQGFIEGRIRELEYLIHNATVVENNHSTDKIEIGKNVKVKNGKETKEFTLVGANEADPVGGKISNESPLGEALLGKKIGEKIEIQTPKGLVKYQILEIY